jgi:flagellar biosynthesis/type III secretory pathway protein FliH
LEEDIKVTLFIVSRCLRNLTRSSIYANQTLTESEKVTSPPKDAERRSPKRQERKPSEKATKEDGKKDGKEDRKKDGKEDGKEDRKKEGKEDGKEDRKKDGKWKMECGRWKWIWTPSIYDLEETKSRILDELEEGESEDQTDHNNK